MAADRLDAYANWIKSNVDKKGTPEFEKVATAYKKLRSESLASKPASSDAIPTRMKAPEPTALETGGRIAAGLLTGAATIPEILLSPTGLTERGRTEEAFRQLMGIPEDSMAFGGGKMGGEVLATMGVPVAAARTVGRALPAAAKTPYVNKLLSAIETGGFGKMAGAPAGAPISAQAAQAAQNYMTRVAGGAIGGGITGAALEGDLEGAGEGALIGGAVPAAVRPLAPAVSAVGKATKSGVEFVQNIKNPKAHKLIEATGSKLESIISELGKDAVIVPGTQVGAGEAAVKAGSTGFSSLVQNVLNDAKKIPEIGDILSDREQANMLARNLYNRGIFQSTDEAERALIDAAGARGIENESLKGLSAGMKREEQALAERGAGLSGEIKEAKQVDIGDAISNARSAQIKSISEKKVSPLYEKAKEYSQDFDISNVRKAASEVRKNLVPFGKDLSTETNELLSRLEPTVTPAKFNPLTLTYEGGKITPPSINMEEAIELSKALNREFGYYEGSGIQGSKIIVNNIGKLKEALADAIRTKVPKEYADKFFEANKAHKNLIADPFYTSEFEKLARKDSVGQPILQSSDVASRIFGKPEFAKQIAEQLKDSPEGRNAAIEGIEDLFRKKAVDADGNFKASAAKSFLKANKEALDALEAGGIKIKDRLQSFADRGSDITKQAKLVKLRQKGLQYDFPEDMRADFIKNPQKIKVAAEYMSDADKQGLSKGFLQDAFSDTQNASKFLTENKRAIMDSLEQSHPGQAQKLYSQAMSTAELYNQTILNDKLLGEFAPSSNSLELNQKIAKLTEGLSPKQMRDVSAIRREIERGAEFERLAAGGKQKGSNIVGEALEAATGKKKPNLLNRFYTAAKTILESTVGTLNERQAAELAKTFLEPQATRKALQEARAWQAANAASMAKLERIGQRMAKTGEVGARAGVAASQNSMAESRNRNALNQ